MGVYTVFDKVAMESGPLFFAQNDDVAKRMVLQMTKNSPELLDDYELSFLGFFDVKTRGFEPYPGGYKIIGVEKR